MSSAHIANYTITPANDQSSSSSTPFINYYILLTSSLQSSPSPPSGYSTTIDLSPVTFLHDSFKSIYNETDIFNTSNALLDMVNSGNATTEDESWSYCDEWTPTQHNLYQTANVIMSVAFLVPATFKQSVLLVRALLIISYILLSCYSSNELCAPDMLTWNLLLGGINFVYTCSLIRKFLPPTFTVELTELYVKVFQSFRVSKKHYKELIKDVQMVTLNKGDIYAVADASPADERLSILISGKLRVTCDDIHLHFIDVHQFIDSPEWEANHEQSDDLFQVTITAEEDSVYICWSRMRLERVLRHRPMLKIVLDSIIGKDIAQKLYSLNDHLCGLDIERARIKRNELHEIWSKATRSMSMDALFTGPSGKVQSTALRLAIKLQRNTQNISTLSISDPQHNRHKQQRWIPIIANHFPAEFPFTGLQAFNEHFASQNPDLLAHTQQTQFSENSSTTTTGLIVQQIDVPVQTPVKRTRSFIRRPQREVKFEDALIPT